MCFPSSFNRTFMELKWIFWSEITYLLIVLIVPLWNWNIESELILNGGDMF